MAYASLNLENGETLTAEHIKHIEEGIIAAEEEATGSTNEFLGQTPLTLTTNVSQLQFVGDGEIKYTIQTDTVADIETATIGAAIKSTLTQLDGGGYRLEANSSVSAWYEPYVDINFAGLTIGESYVLICAGKHTIGGNADEAGNGAVIVYDSANNTLIDTLSFEHALTKRTFTTTTETIRIRLYPAGSYYYNNGCRTAEFNSIYINRANTSTNHTSITNISGTFTDSAKFQAMGNGTLITSDPVCEVYAVVKSEDEMNVMSRHGGKTCVCFGDSITGNMFPPSDYPTIIADETGMTVYNGGFGGCRMGIHPTTAYNAFCMHSLADSIASGDWALQDNNIGNVSSFIHADTQLANLKAVDWNNVDFITIAYGTNDIASGMSLDNSNDKKDTSTILGALRYSIEKILSTYPQIKILLLTPIYRYWNDEDIDSDSKTFALGKFTDLVDGILRVAEEYKIPSVDMYRTLGFNSITRSYYFPSNDGTHPNAEGLKVMGGKIAARLLAEF